MVKAQNNRIRRTADPGMLEMDRRQYDVLYCRTTEYPAELYESASIDGANGFRQLVGISIPLLKPTTTYVLTISINAGLSMFIESYMLWKGNNSPGNIGLTIVGYLYRQGIEKNAMGYASAVGILLLLVVLAINMTQLYLTGFFRKEESV